MFPYIIIIYMSSSVVRLITFNLGGKTLMILRGKL